MYTRLPKSAHAEELAESLGEQGGIRDADVGHRAGRQLDARRGRDPLAVERYGRRAARVDVQADVRVGFWLEEFERHWRATCLPFRVPQRLCLSAETKIGRLSGRGLQPSVQA